MKNIKKITLLMIMMLTVFSFAGCSKENKENSNDTTQGTEADSEDSNNVSKDLVAKVGDTEVYLDEIMVYIEPLRYQYEASYGTDIWATEFDGYTFEDMAKESVMDQVIYIKTTNIKAKERGITLTDEEKGQIDTLSDDYIASIDETGLVSPVSKDLMVKIYSENSIAKKVFEDEAKNLNVTVSDEEAKQITVQHLLVKTTEYDEAGKLVDLPEDKQKEALAKAEDLLVKAKETDDFMTLAQENTEDSGVEYTFGKGKMDSAFEEASFALKTGEVSGLVKSAYGYHIIYCVSDFEPNATESAKSEILLEKQQEAFAPIYEEWKKEYPAEINDDVWGAVRFASEETDEGSVDDIETTTLEQEVIQ